VWNPRAFKGQVSPHEFMQAVMAASNKRFIIDRQSDPVEFLSWLVNSLHLDLTGGKRKKRSGEASVWGLGDVGCVWGGGGGMQQHLGQLDLFAQVPTPPPPHPSHFCPHKTPTACRESCRWSPRRVQAKPRTCTPM
jgi:U4/U6.U5 tri-snRNP-associated protein 2